MINTTKETIYLVCHNGVDIYHYVEQSPGCHTITAQPLFEQDLKLEDLKEKFSSNVQEEIWPASDIVD